MTQLSKTLIYLVKDPVIWSAVFCAGLFWLLLSFYVPITHKLMWPLLTPFDFIIPVILYPVIEEIVFRGMVQEFLQKKLSGIVFFQLTKANVVTSIIFTALHFLYHPPLWASTVLLPSLYFGFLKERYQNLVPPILLHVFFNAGYYWLFTHL